MALKDQQDESPGFFSLPFLDHLEELRKRLIRSALAVILTTGAALYFSDHIIRFFISPLGPDIKLHVTDVTGSFYAYMKMALITGILAAIPIVFYQLWSFVSPGLYAKEKRAVIPMVLVSTVLFLSGAAFCFYIVLPFALKFMIGFSGDLFSPIITVGSYISFSGMLLLAFGFCFQLPVIAYYLGRVGIINSAFLSKGRRYAIVIILLVAGILTPTPDVATQMMLAVPLYVLYEASILLVYFTGKKKKAE